MGSVPFQMTARPGDHPGDASGEQSGDARTPQTGKQPAERVGAATDSPRATDRAGADWADRPGEFRLAPGVHVRATALRFSFTPSSGPGGQNVNRRSTKATLRVELGQIGLDAPGLDRLRRVASHLVTKDDEIVISSDTHRSQARNRAECLELLRALVLSAAARPKTRRATRPTKGSVERRIDEKKKRSAVKGLRRRPPE